jgi:hypothetical protein
MVYSHNTNNEVTTEEVFCGLAPSIGMEFNLVLEAKIFYEQYAIARSFSIRKSSMKFSLDKFTKNKMLSYKKFVCCAEGFS